jgi:hypothetical protein
MRLIAVAAIAVVVGVATAGCAGEPTRATAQGASAGSAHDLPAEVTSHMGAPVGTAPTREHGRLVGVAASWDPSAAARLRITVWGSGTCPSVGASASVAEDGATVRMAVRSYPANQGCTLDLRPATSVVTLPPGAELARRTNVVVTDSAGNRWSVVVQR